MIVAWKFNIVDCQRVFGAFAISHQSSYGIIAMHDWADCSTPDSLLWQDFTISITCLTLRDSSNRKNIIESRALLLYLDQHAYCILLMFTPTAWLMEYSAGDNASLETFRPLYVTSQFSNSSLLYLVSNCSVTCARNCLILCSGFPTRLQDRVEVYHR